MKRFITGLLIALSLSFGLGSLASPAYAASPTDAAKSEICAGVSGSVAGSSCGTGGVDINKIMVAVLNILSVVAGVAGVIMVIISGLRYITSSGDAQAVSGAKRTLIYALVGLVVVAFSQFIVHFVLYNVSK